VQARHDLLPALGRQEVERFGRNLAAERGLTFHTIEDSQTVSGKLIGSTQLVSGDLR
jgi:hypothetical protein